MQRQFWLTRGCRRLSQHPNAIVASTINLFRHTHTHRVSLSSSLSCASASCMLSFSISAYVLAPAFFSSSFCKVSRFFVSCSTSLPSFLYSSCSFQLSVVRFLPAPLLALLLLAALELDGLALALLVLALVAAALVSLPFAALAADLDDAAPPFLGVACRAC